MRDHKITTFKALYFITLVLALATAGVSLGLMSHYSTINCLLFITNEKLNFDTSLADINLEEHDGVPCKFCLASAIIATVSLAVVANIELIKQVSGKNVTFKTNPVLIAIETLLQLLAFAFELILLITASVGWGITCQAYKETLNLNCHDERFQTGIYSTSEIVSIPVFAGIAVISLLIGFIGFILLQWQLSVTNRNTQQYQNMQEEPNSDTHPLHTELQTDTLPN